MSARRDHQVVVVGAGFGGLAAAAHLSEMGARVTIFERDEEVGGKAARLERGGFVFDAGPTLLTLPAIVEETFRAAGARDGDCPKLERLDPICALRGLDGREIVFSTSEVATRASIGAVAPEDAERWPRFLADCRALYHVAGEPYLEAPFQGPVGLVPRMLRAPEAFRALGLAKGTLADFGRERFRSEAMRAFVGHFAFYLGGVPTATSAALALVPHVELGIGAFYPRGGINAMALALARALEKRGVTIERGREVLRIECEGREVRGVTVAARGDRDALERFDADAVIADVDPLHVVERLLPETRQQIAERAALSARERSLSALVWSFGLEGEWPASAMHTLLFGRAFEEESIALREGRLVDEPTIYVSVPSLIDSTRAPPGHHVVFTLLNLPATANTAVWNAEIPRLRRLILARLERFFGPGLAGRIRAETFVTPHDLAAQGAPWGAIHGAAPHGWRATFQRPRNRADGVRGLYYVGGATHPGGGVSLVMRGGRFVAELLAKDGALG